MSGAACARGASADSGAGSTMALGIIAVLFAVVVLALPLCSVLVSITRASNAADASALAAADVAIGLVPGVPCAVAESIASRNRARLDACLVDGRIVTVEVSVAAAGLRVAGRATAGPPSEAVSEP